MHGSKRTEEPSDEEGEYRRKTRGNDEDYTWVQKRASRDATWTSADMHDDRGFVDEMMQQQIPAPVQGSGEKTIQPIRRIDGKLTGLKALVTGASRGIGREIAMALAEEGADVAINYNRSDEDADTLAMSIEVMGKNTWVYPADISDYNQVQSMRTSLTKYLGPIDILVNNAGINIHKKALDFTQEDLDRMLRVNSKGVYFCSQAAARLMIPRKEGKIINIASVTAFLVRAGIANSVYAMTKAGTVMLTKALAEEWAQYHINVNTIAPGYFATPMVADRLKDPEVYNSIIGSTPLGRVGGPEDIMGVAVFLASDASNYITGQTICLDGGRTVL